MNVYACVCDTLHSDVRRVFENKEEAVKYANKKDLMVLPFSVEESNETAFFVTADHEDVLIGYTSDYDKTSKIRNSYNGDATVDEFDLTTGQCISSW